MDTVQLETFFSVIEQKNFSKAAEALNCSQPTASARIKNLENELDCKLFEKDGKNVTLTKEGEIFYGYAKTIFLNMIQSKEAAKHSKFHHIKIGFSPGFSYSFITELITSILSIDNIEVSIYEGKDSLYLNDQIIAGNYDLVFTRNYPISKPNIISELLFDDRLVLVCGKNHCLANKEIITPEDLEGETMICYQRHTPLWNEIEQQLVGVPNIKRIEVGNNEMVKTVVGNGVGIGITSSLGVNEIDKMKLVSKRMKQVEDIPNQVYVQYRKNSLIETAIKKMIYSIINHEIEQ